MDFGLRVGLKAERELQKQIQPSLLVKRSHMQTKKAVSITVHGRVQGVGFRYYVKRNAIHLGIQGYVKNQDDGNVYVEAVGHEDSIVKLIAVCKEGPVLSKVTTIEVKDIKLSHYTDFHIEK